MSAGRVMARTWKVAKAFGAQRLLEAAFGRAPAILMYHRFSREPMSRRVSAAVFDRQMAYAARYCNVVSWPELVAGLRDGVAWKSNTVAISIDDGYSDLYEVAFPILEKYRLPVLAFVTSGFANGDFWHWTDQLHHILTNCRERGLRLDTAHGALVLPLRTQEERMSSWSELADRCYELPEATRSELVEEVSRRAHVPTPQQPPPDYRPASWDQLRSMMSAGLTIGAHSATHPRLTRLNDADLVTEVEGSKLSLENELQVAVTAFAYPFGTPADHDARVSDAVRRAGFRSGCVAYFDTQLHEDLFALRRFGIGADDWDFLKTVDGLKRARSLQKKLDR